MSERCGFRNDEGLECWLPPHESDKHYFDLYSLCEHWFQWLRVDDRRNLGGKHDVFFCTRCLIQRTVKR